VDLKDYYKILELPPSATIKEIKTAYRRLAHQFHPDKNSNDLYAEAQFKLIKEAYEVLTDPARKEYYLQQRWYANSQGKKGTSTPATPVTILRGVLQLDRYLSQVDIYRADRGTINSQIAESLSEENIQTLNHFNETEINKVIIRTLVKHLGNLPFPVSRELAAQLGRIRSDEITGDLITHNLGLSRKNEKWRRVHPWVIIVVVALICILIYGISR